MLFILYFLLFTWIFSVTISLFEMVTQYVKKDYDKFISSLKMFFFFLLTGYATFIPLLIAYNIDKRFKKIKD